jgi:hypothetical protein
VGLRQGRLAIVGAEQDEPKSGLVQKGRESVVVKFLHSGRRVGHGDGTRQRVSGFLGSRQCERCCATKNTTKGGAEAPPQGLSGFVA